MPQVTINYCGIDASGRNVTEAKKKAAQELAAFVRDAGGGPRFAHCCGTLVCVFRTADQPGWAYALVDRDGLEAAHARVAHAVDARAREAASLIEPCRVQGYETADDAMRAAFYHAAQNAWSLEIADDEEFLSRAFPPSMRDRAATLRGWIQWQRRYAAAKAAGATDDAAFSIASRA